MANLNATADSLGGQSSTQSPQSATGSGAGGTPTGAVQTGTAANLLVGQGGIPLDGTAVSTINLAPQTIATSTTSAIPLPSPAKHHFNPMLLGFSAALILAAVALFWATTYSVKSTT